MLEWPIQRANNENRIWIWPETRMDNEKESRVKLRVQPVQKEKWRHGELLRFWLSAETEDLPYHQTETQLM